MTEKNKYTVIKKDIAYKGKVIDIQLDTVEYDGRRFTWEIGVMGNAIVIVPEVAPGKFVLIHQYRHAIGEYLWEFPAGKIEDGEDIEECLQRELDEECSYRARAVERLLTFYPTPGICTEKMYLYRARDLYHSEECERDIDEIIETHIFNGNTIEKMINDGEIVDGKTILAYYYLKSS